MYPGGTNDMEYRKKLQPLAKMAFGSDLTENSSVRNEEAGAERWALTPYGRAFYRYTYSATAITRGELVSFLAGISVANITSGSTTTAVTSGLTANAYQYDVLIVLDVNASAGASPEGHCSPIKSNSTTTIYLDAENPLPAALAVNDDCYVMTFCKTEDSAAGDCLSDVAGVAMADRTPEYWGWVQYKGVCPYALVRAGVALAADKAIIAHTARLDVSNSSSDELLLGTTFQGIGNSADIVDDVFIVKLDELGRGRQVSA